MVFTDNFTPTTTTTTTSPPPHEPDDISAFLRQLLHRSSSSSSSSSSVFLPSTTTVEMHANAPGNSKSSLLTAFTTTNNVFPTSGLFSGLDRGTHQPTTGYQTGCYPVSGGGSHLSSINDFTEDYDYESEEGAAEETEAGTGARQTRLRNQSKRTRAAEVHNLSEKRRRSRINEKMKALQNLIPNSNKTDKASMLDEAIEYLKQLQLQVQMLSMRNGMSLHPMCLPEEQGSLHATQLSQIGMHNLNNNINTPFDHLTMSSSLNIIPDTSHSAFNLANLLSSTTRPPLSTFADVINSEGTFGIDSGARPSFRPFQSQNPDPHQTVCREQSPPHERLTINKHEMNSLVTTMPPSFGAGNSIVEENHNPRDAHTPTKYASQELLLENILGQNPRSSSLFSGLHAASSSAQNDKLATGR